MHVNQNVRHIPLYSYFSFPYISSCWLWLSAVLTVENNYWSFFIVLTCESCLHAAENTEETFV